MTTKLIITVDTEEEGLWSNSFRASGNTVENISGVPSFQQICDNHHLKPVYLVNSPVIEDDKASAILREIHSRGDCEIGSHIHPWNTPPVQEHCDSFDSYLCNLDHDVQARKLKVVTDSIENRFGTRPLSFRSGRYGLDISGINLLSELGYTIDSSVCPFTDYSDDGGPDFRGYPWRPYYVGEKFDQSNEVNSGILEVPVSFGYNWSNFDTAFKVHEALATDWLKRFRLRGIFSRLNLLNKIKFSPEKHDATELKTLARIYSQQHNPSIVMMFHSSSLVSGHSPYVPNDVALKNFLGVIDELIDYCLNSLDMESATLAGFAQSYTEISG